MHTTKVGTTTFMYDGDFGEDIEIYPLGYCPAGDGIKIPFEDLLGFVAEYVRRQKISDLEQMDDREIIGIRKD